MIFHSFPSRLLWQCAVLLVGLIAGAAAHASATLHEVVVVPASPDTDNRRYTLCVQAPPNKTCIWSVAVTEDEARALPNRPMALAASQDGLRIAAVLRKRQGSLLIDELWRFNQQMSPDLAVPGQAANRNLITKSRLIATGFPLTFVANATLNRFLINDGRSLQLVDDRGSRLAVVHTASADAPALQFVGSADNRAGILETTPDGARRRLVIADIELGRADSYDLRALPDAGEVAWNFEHAWVAVASPREASARSKTAPQPMRVIDLRHGRMLGEFSRGGLPISALRWEDPLTLHWRGADGSPQFQRLDAPLPLRLHQGWVRAQGERLMFLPCRERTIVLLDDMTSSRALIDAVRQRLGDGDKVYLEGLGARVGSSLTLDSLSLLEGGDGGCNRDTPNALFEARGVDRPWSLVVNERVVRFRDRETQTWAVPKWRAAWVDGEQHLSVRSAEVSLELIARPTLCSLGNGRIYGQTVTATLRPTGLATRTLHGCGAWLGPLP